MPDDLRPPPESAHLRWHWIATPSGDEPWGWLGVWWPPGSGLSASRDQMLHCRYLRPCDPAALTINPEDAGQVERVARAWRREEDRWGVRTGDEGGAEIYRHSRLGVVSPVVVATTTHKEARMLLDKMRDSAAARAALKALSDA